MTASKSIRGKGVLLLTLSLSAAAMAESQRVFPLKPLPGYARPPLHVNVTPMVATSYTPAQIRHVYGLDQLSANGTGQKIGIVDAYGNQDMQANLDQFCTTFNLPKTTIQVLGHVGVNTGWALETALDVEWAHVIATNATIIVSVARTAKLTDLLAAVDAAVNAGATVVSMSWGASEFSGQNTYDTHFNVSGITFTASSGDNGAGVEWPSVSSYVVGVGGTSLYLDGSNNRSSETAWSGSGGGSSAYLARPSFQNGWQGTPGRGVPDVSLVADPNTGVQVYDVNNGGWVVVGGTSASAPMWAGLIALANQSRTTNLSSTDLALYLLGQGPVNQNGAYVGLYSVNPTYFYDVTQGNNGTYTAAPPYDFVTGMGVPFANTFIPALAAFKPDFTVAVNPVSQTVGSGGVAVNYTVTVTFTNGFSGTVTLGTSGLPAGAVYSYSPPTLSGSGPSTLSVTAAGGTPAGSYPFTVTGTSGSLAHNTGATLVIGAPAAPTPVSPTGGGIGSTPTYTFTTVPGASSYQIWLYDGSVWTTSTSWYTSAQVDPSNTGTGNINLPITLAPGWHYWVIRAQNAAGTGPWGSGISFVVGSLPVAPTPLSPTGGDISPTPTYAFSTVLGATSYQIWLYDGSTWTTGTSWYTSAQVDPSNTGTGSINLPITLAGGYHYWVVRAQNAVGIGPWGTGLSFVVGSLPAAPTALGPQGAGISATPTYTFTTVLGATSYQIWLYDGSTWTTDANWYTSSQVDPLNTGTGSITLPTPLSSGYHYWVPHAQNSAGIGPWGSGLSFSVP